MISPITYKSTDLVLSSWERARQEHSTEENLGVEFLMRFFVAAPESKKLFGFRNDQDVLANPKLRIGVLVHAQLVVRKINEVMTLIGPDIDDLETMIGSMGILFAKNNITSDTIQTAMIVLRQTLAHNLKNHWNDDIDEAWMEVMTKLSKSIFN
jgi:hemoglobin-like flavoprotein